MERIGKVFVVEEADYLQWKPYYSRVHGVFRNLKDAERYVMSAEAVNCIWRDRPEDIIHPCREGIYEDELNERFIMEVTYREKDKIRHDTMIIRPMRLE